ncbi:MAG: type III secretion system chaperone [Deltaproteobacteria bacterium]|nr:type III secretion system chaperone [Deltaproteobacteria bacterium]
MDSLIFSTSEKKYPLISASIAVATATALLALIMPLQTVAQPVPRYMNAVKQEIARLGYKADCRDSEGICTLMLVGLNEIPPLTAPVSIIVDDSSATIRFMLPDLLPDTLPTGEIAQQLLRMNHQLVVAKLSIDDRSNKIVLSAVVNTDSNFDRKTFRSTLKGFIQVARDVITKFSTSEDPNQN